jgi:hypothetical protein
MQYSAMRIKNEAPQEETAPAVFCEICGRSSENLTPVPDLYAAPLMACPTCYLKDCEAA